MHFRSDNTAPAAPEILAAVSSANVGAASAYGEDTWSKRLNAAYAELFEHDCFVFTVATGTAANAIALASAAPPWGSVLTHRESHIECDEGGAPEFFAGGAKLALLDGAHAKIDAPAVEKHLRILRHGVHSPLPAAISISQASERGAVYRPDEIVRLSATARREKLALHMDGARLANAVAHLGCKPADVTWRAGVDLLSFGATKNGALGAEAVIVFDSKRAEEIARRRKRGGHLMSKGRYAAAQLLAYIDKGLWLSLAARANALATRIGAAADVFLSAPVESNQVFIRPGVEGLKELRAAGVEFYDWGAEGSGEARLVVSWNQDEDDVEQLCALLGALKRSVVQF
jgi:threonine aldolase